MTIHWTTKSLLGKFLLDTKEERNEILLQMDELNDKTKFLIKPITIKEYGVLAQVLVP